MTPAELRAILARLGLSQTQAARRIGVGLRTVNRWVRGEAGIPRPIALLFRMMDAQHNSR
jgi:transcriptional regulator with XRE-family HTH domain